LILGSFNARCSDIDNHGTFFYHIRCYQVWFADRYQKNVGHAGVAREVLRILMTYRNRCMTLFREHHAQRRAGNATGSYYNSVFTFRFDVISAQQLHHTEGSSRH
jgi:hypothetical protein